MGRTVLDVMTAKPVQVTPDETVVNVARLMSEQDIGTVLVADGGTLVGVVTDRDIVVRAVAQDRGPETQVGLLCTTEPVTIYTHDSVQKADSLMQEHALRRLPVVADGKAVGIVSLGDLAAAQNPESTLGRIKCAGRDRARTRP